MKNQNDLIISIVAIVLGLIGFSIGFFTKRQVTPPATPEVTNLAPPKLQGAEVQMANALPSAQNTTGQPGGVGGPAPAGGAPTSGPGIDRAPNRPVLGGAAGG